MIHSESSLHSEPMIHSELRLHSEPRVQSEDSFRGPLPRSLNAQLHQNIKISSLFAFSFMLVYSQHLITQETRFLAILCHGEALNLNSQMYLDRRHKKLASHRNTKNDNTSLLILVYTKTKQYKIEGFENFYT
jgi:hypothetical protein